MGLDCLFSGKWEVGHNRRDCKKCKMVYARRWRLTAKGKENDQKHYNAIKGSQMYVAIKRVYIAVRARRLVPPFWCACVDCGAVAEVYDHRDYSKPLDVQPVCRSCNLKRGPGLNKD